MGASRSFFRGIAWVASCGALVVVTALPERQARVAETTVEKTIDARCDRSEARGADRELQKRLLHFEQEAAMQDFVRAQRHRERLHPRGDFLPPGRVRVD